jgi:hypothetical protein
MFTKVLINTPTKLKNHHKWWGIMVHEPPFLYLVIEIVVWVFSFRAEVVDPVMSRVSCIEELLCIFH